MDKKYICKENINKKKAWYLFVWAGIFFFFYLAFRSHGETLLKNLHNFENDTFMDFFNSITYERHPYENDVIYPPLVNLIYYIVHALVPQSIFSEGALAIRDSQIGRIIIGLYISITTVLFCYSVLKTKKGKLEEKIFFLFTLILSMPFLYQLERANIIILSLIFLMLFIEGYQSDNMLHKHMALFSLAVSASIKIYPVFWGLLLIREKRWKDALWCIFYGIIVFFGPFCLFGGAKSIPLFITNILNCTKYMVSTGVGLKLSISNTLSYLGILIFDNIHALDIFCILVKIICFVGGILLMLFSTYKQTWKLYMVPTLMIILIPDFSFLYSLIYIVIPLISFLDQEEKLGKIDVIYFVLFVVLLIPIVNCKFDFLEKFSNDYYPLTSSVMLESILCLIFMYMIWMEGIAGIIAERCKTYINK